MNQSNQQHRSNGRTSRLIRWLILGFGGVMVVGVGAYFVLTHTTFQLTLVNDTSEIMTVRHVETVTGKSFSWTPVTGQAGYSTLDSADATSTTPDHVSLMKDHKLPPHTNLTLTLNGWRQRCVLLDLGIPKSKGTFQLDATWGYRWRIGYDAANNDVYVYETTTVRKLFDAIYWKLPLPASWRE